MGTFIRVKIDGQKCMGIKKSGECVKVCPVNIFEPHGDAPVVVTGNEDECTLCRLCLEKCPSGAISIQKLYEN